MGDTITRRLVNKVQTEGAAQSERDMAKVEQAGAKAGAGIAGGMKGAEKATEQASAAIEDKLDGLGKKFEITDKASEIIGKIGTAFGLVGAAAALLTPIIDELGKAFFAQSKATQAAAADLDLAKVASDELEASLGKLAFTANESTVKALEAVSRAGKRAEQDITTARARIEGLELAREQGLAPDYLIAAGWVRPGESVEQAIARNEAVIERAKGAYAAASRVIEKGVKEIQDAAAPKDKPALKKAIVEVHEEVYQDLAGMAEFIATQYVAAAEKLLGAFLKAPAEDPFAALKFSIGQMAEDAVAAKDEVLSLYAEFGARSAEAEQQGRDMASGFGAAAEAMASVALAAVMGGESMTKAIGKYMAAESLKFGAISIGALAQAGLLAAFGDFAGAAEAATAAGNAALAAAAFGAGGALLGGFSGGGGGGGSAAAGTETPSATDLMGRQEEPSGGGVVINLNFQGQPLVTNKDLIAAAGQLIAVAGSTRGNALYGALGRIG